MTEPVDVHPDGLTDAELRRRVRYWRGEGRGIISADGMAAMYEAELQRRGLDVPGRAGTRTMPPKMSDDSLKKLARLIAVRAPALQRQPAETPDDVSFSEL